MPPGTALSPGDAVLLAFENADPALPIIIGQPRDLPEPDPQGDNPGTIRTPHDITMTVSSLHLDARQEIVLRCGEGSLTIRADGTVVLRGTRLLSRSSGSNKIQGASIRLN
jgi:hypothetical protein